MMDLAVVETELKKRLALPYKWGMKQNDFMDRQTNFVYDILNFNDLLNGIDVKFKDRQDYETLKNYALNRWFNALSARALEQIFCDFEGVKAYREKDKFTDFEIRDIKFDLKTSKFPERFSTSLSEAVNNKRDLIRWLYRHQSEEQRHHLKNRLFMILYSRDKNHWKLKAEILWLREIINNYLVNFNPARLENFSHNGETVLSDIIWAIKI